MNSDELTQSLNEPTPDTQTTQPILKELLADVRELKASSVTKTDLAEAVALILERIEGVEREQRLMRYGQDKIAIRQSRSEERIMELEKEVLGDYKIVA
jgi:hypothetical protein